MKLWVDDVREAPLGWSWAKTYADAISLLDTGEYSVVSLDHDLGEEKTGYDVALWLAERAYRGDKTPKVRCHSANPVGVERIEGVIERYLEWYVDYV